MTTGLWSLAWLLALLAAAPATAQDTPFTAPSGSRPVIRPDGTYVFNHLPDSDLIFEAQIAPRIIIMDSIGRATRRVLAAEKDAAWGWQVSATPMVKLRILNEGSNPVRTPSYMPKATVQIARLQNMTRADVDDEDAFSKGPIAMWLLDVIPFGHHSNGQTGCLFTNERRLPNGDCSGALPGSRSINTIDGSFSTNYLEATAHYGRLHLDSENAPDTEYATRWEWRVGGGVQVNPKGFAGGSIKDELARLYGQTRMLLESVAAKRDAGRCGRAEASVGLQYIHDAPTGVPDVTTRLEAVCFPRSWGGAGLFARFYRGQDYYNLAFGDRITRLQFGVTVQKDAFLSFKIRSQ